MGSLLALSLAIEARDPYTRGHSARVTEFALAIARRLEPRAHVVQSIQVGGPLHDIGKVGIPERVLLKPGPLDETEFGLIREHPRSGAVLIDGIPAFRTALDCVLHHHERWDGDGYPHRLSGSGIPLAARILAVADAFDAMTSTRPYRRALGPREAAREVERCSGSQFDPEVASAFSAAFEADELEPELEHASSPV
jgi:HD-GYP domain-containing protein (c-di-GMP phosphodiesterase class II)